MRHIIDGIRRVAVTAAERAAITFATVATGSAMIDAVNEHSWTAAEHVLVAAATAAAVAAITAINGAVQGLRRHAGGR